MPSRSIKRRWRWTILALLAVALTTFVAAGWREARQDPVVRRTTIALAGLPRGSPPLRLALVSDMHIGNLAMPVARLDRIVDQINAEKPDAILLAGDFVNGSDAESWDFHPRLLAAPLSRLRAPLGLFAVLGNHDAETSPALVEQALHQAHITVLTNGATRIGGIALAGLDDISMHRGWPSQALAAAHRLGGVPVILAHSPEFLGWLPHDAPLIMVGHTHCGQIVLPGWSNAFDLIHWRYRFNPRYACGEVREPGRTVLITGGVGAATIPPLRLNAPPDIWIVTLRPESG